MMARCLLLSPPVSHRSPKVAMKHLFAKISLFTVWLSISFMPTAQALAKEPFPASEMVQTIPTDPALLKGKLANGLQYYILRHTQPTKNVELRLVVRAGSVNELEHERGISHFLEHMVFNGTRLYPKHELIDALENMGVQFGTDLNAYTGFDETTYILPIPLNNPENFEKSIGILEQLAFHATLLPEDIDQERSVLMEEWRASELSATARQQEHNLKLTTAGSLYAERMPMGKTDVIQHASPEVLRGFYQRWYRPNLMSVVVVGDVSPSHAKKLIEKHFASYQNPSPFVPTPNNRLPNNTTPLVGMFNDKTLPQSTVMIANKDPKDFVALDTTGAYIDNLRVSLMVTMINQRLQAQLDTPNSAPPFLQAAVDFDYMSGLVRSKQALQWYAVAAPNQEEKTLATLHNEALRVIQHGFTQPELDRAVREHLTFLNSNPNNFQKATEYVRGIVENEPLPEVEWERATQRRYLPLIGLNEINQIAQRLIQADNRVALINSNRASAPITQARMLAILNQSTQQSAYTESQERDKLLSAEPTAGKVVRTEFHPEVKLTVWTLSNGVQVGFRSSPNNDGPIIFSGVSKGGFSRLSDADWVKVRWGMDGLVDGGLNGLSKTQVNHVLAGKDVSMQMFFDENTQGVAGKFNAKDSESAMQMVYSLLTGVNKNPETFKTHLARSAAAAKSLAENRDAQFEQSIQTALNHNNPRFDGVIPTDKRWQNTDFDTTYRSYRQAFANANGMYFTFVGNADAKHMKQLAERYLGSLPADLTQNNQARDTGARLDFTPRRIEVAKGKEALAQVRLMFGGETPYNETDSLALQALAHALNIRLVERLREQEGGVYSPYAYASMSKLPYSQYDFTAEFSCAPQNVNTLIASTQDEIKQLMTNGMREQDLLKFKQAEITTYAKRIRTNEFWAAGFEQAHLTDTPLTRLTDYPKRVNALTAEDIHAAAKKYLSEKALVAVLQPE